MRYLLAIWKASRPMHNGESWETMRRELSVLYSRFCKPTNVPSRVFKTESYCLVWAVHTGLLADRYADCLLLGDIVDLGYFHLVTIRNRLVTVDFDVVAHYQAVLAWLHPGCSEGEGKRKRKREKKRENLASLSGNALPCLTP
ncbi:hypothetical protein B296_00034071 [Ensete ventricosum]|uniref:RING-type E3 ubiquitin transferase n=1 Tax=Ensete ventricosum TaxID=4639 RepID=A0A426ZUK3_ENSVE|nr:hypothetical protein B296_00034071 [Ensete ventricosum]